MKRNPEFDFLQELMPLWQHIPGIQFWIKDAQGRFLAANPAFYGHFGFRTFAELRGKTDYDISPWHLAREYVQDDQAVLASGKVQANKMELVREHDGNLHWYATTKIPLRDAKRRIIGTAGHTRPLQPSHDGHAAVEGMDQVVEHILKHHGKAIAIGDLAAMAGLSLVQFERRFKSLFRETPLKFINRVRMRAAARLLLHSDLSVGEIARRTGFADASYFTKRFQAHLRIRPLEYRRKYAPASSRPAPA